jgi:hypothetical protein
MAGLEKESTTAPKVEGGGRESELKGEGKAKLRAR